MTTLHFRADAGTPALISIKEYFDQCTATLRAVVEFISTRYGVSDARMYRCGDAVLGVAAPLNMSGATFAGLLGPDWKRTGHTFTPYVKKNKRLHQEWKALPKLPSLEALKGELTGVKSFIHWMDGLTLHGMGLTFKTDLTLSVIELPLCVCEHKSFKPREGMIRVVDAIEAARLWKSCG